MTEALRLDPRMPLPDRCVLPRILDRHAADTPDRIFAVFADGEQWSYAQTRTQALRLAGGLKALGVRRHDKVLIWLPNGKLALRAWFGTNYIGAVSVAINTAYRGDLLEHVVCNSDATVAICHEDLVDRLLEISNPGALQTVISSPAAAASLHQEFAARGIVLQSFDCLDSTPATDIAGELAPWDLQSICYTSGTTGPSKGVLSSYLHLHSMGWHCTDGVTADDRYLINLPLLERFHNCIAIGARLTYHRNPEEGYLREGSVCLSKVSVPVWNWTSRHAPRWSRSADHARSPRTGWSGPRCCSPTRTGRRFRRSRAPCTRIDPKWSAASTRRCSGGR